MAVTYEPIATTTLTSNTTAIVFSSIPSTYTDLICVVVGTHTGSGVAGLYISSINGDTGTNYCTTIIQGDSSAALSYKGNNVDAMNIGLINSAQSNSIFQFMNYGNTITHKIVLARGNDANALVRQGVGVWRNNSAITSFSVSMSTIASGTTATLYGIKAA